MKEKDYILIEITRQQSEALKEWILYILFFSMLSGCLFYFWEISKIEIIYYLKKYIL